MLAIFDDGMELTSTGLDPAKGTCGMNVRLKHLPPPLRHVLLCEVFVGDQITVHGTLFSLHKIVIQQRDVKGGSCLQMKKGGGKFPAPIQNVAPLRS